MIRKCPDQIELLEAALGWRIDTGLPVAQHVEHCTHCRQLVREIRSRTAALYSMQPSAPLGACLDDDQVALFVDGSGTPSTDLLHLAECEDCRARIVAVTRLLADADVSAETRALLPGRTPIPNRWSRRRLIVSGGLAAAAVATVIVTAPLRTSIQNGKPSVSAEIRREPAITATVAPRIVTPSEVVRSSDSLRWTSVPTADIYRIKVWDREGTVVWTVDTRDTAVSLPLILQSGTSYLWDVKARTGWDRWVSSDFVELIIRASKAP